MNANPTLLQMKYARIVEKFADMHCRSDEYLVEELIDEIKR